MHQRYLGVCAIGKNMVTQSPFWKDRIPPLNGLADRSWSHKLNVQLSFELTLALDSCRLGYLRNLLSTMNTLSPAPSAGITPRDTPPPIDLKHRDMDYYNVPLVILVRLIVVSHDVSRELIQLSLWTQVEATLFKVSHGYFKNSDVFWETYLFCPGGNEEQDGHTDQQPLRLVGVDAVEFRCLLKAIIQEWVML